MLWPFHKESVYENWVSIVRQNLAHGARPKSALGLEQSIYFSRLPNKKPRHNFCNNANQGGRYVYQAHFPEIDQRTCRVWRELGYTGPCAGAPAQTAWPAGLAGL